MYPGFTRTMRGLLAERLLSGWLWTFIGAAMLIAWGLWLSKAHLQVIESSDRARIEFESPPFHVDVPLAGRMTMDRLILHQRRKAGEVLLEIDSTVEAQRLAEGRAREQGLRQQLASIEAELGARIGAEKAQLREAQAGRAVAELRAEEAEERAKRAALEAERYARLRGQAAELEVLRVESLARERQTDFAAREKEAQQALREQQLRRGFGRLHVVQLLSEQTRLKGQLVVAQASVATISAEVERHRVRAPYDGYIAAARPVPAGSLLQPGERLATMLPDAPLRVVALLEPAAALGRVRPGQPAWLRLQGFPFTQYGRLPLCVSQRADELHDGFLRIELQIVDGGRGFPVPLSHGLPGSADIAVETVTPMELLLRALGRLLTPIRAPQDTAR